MALYGAHTKAELCYDVVLHVGTSSAVVCNIAARYIPALSLSLDELPVQTTAEDE